MENEKKNLEGYADPTAFEALKNVENDENGVSEGSEEPDSGGSKRFHKLLYTIFSLCELSGFTLRGRITLVDKRTGRVWE